MIFSIAMDADYSFYVKNIETHARAFLPHNISAIRTVLQFKWQKKKECAVSTSILPSQTPTWGVA